MKQRQRWLRGYTDEGKQTVKTLDRIASIALAILVLAIWVLILWKWK